MKQIQISEELFIQLVKYHICNDDLWQEEIAQGLQNKLEAMIKRNLYTFHKAFRNIVVDRYGVFSSCNRR